MVYWRSGPEQPAGWPWIGPVSACDFLCAWLYFKAFPDLVSNPTRGLFCAPVSGAEYQPQLSLWKIPPGLHTWDWILLNNVSTVWGRRRVCSEVLDFRTSLLKWVWIESLSRLSTAARKGLLSRERFFDVREIPKWESEHLLPGHTGGIDVLFHQICFPLW